MKVGQVCVKTTGRDAGKKGVILHVLKNQALVDGEVRRRKVNLMHLVATNQHVDIKKDASHEDVKKVLATIGILVRDTTPKQAAPRQKRKHKVKAPVRPKAKKSTTTPAKPETATPHTVAKSDTTTPKDVAKRETATPKKVTKSKTTTLKKD